MSKEIILHIAYILGQDIKLQAVYTKQGADIHETDTLVKDTITLYNIW